MFGTIDFFDDMVKLRKAMDGIFREVNTGYEYPAVDMKDSGEKIRLHHRQGHIAPANAFAQQRMLGAQVGEAPRLGADDRIIPPLGEAGTVGQHELDMLVQVAGGHPV